MHILVTNDDGPLNDETCPYLKFFLDEVERSTNWKMSIVVPNQQRSWIGKAHFAGKTIKTSYIYTKMSTERPNDKINAFEGPFEQRNLSLYQTHQEWHLADSTPAACADLGLHHLSSHDEPIDLVVSGPNFGKNSGNIYILASGTVGAAMEAVTHGVKSIALSYEFRSLEKDFKQLREAAKISVKLIKRLLRDFSTNPAIDLFSVNIPLIPSLECGKTKISYAPILDNTWASIYTPLGNGQYGWAPDFKGVWKSGLDHQDHTDNRVLLNSGVSVTPLKAGFSMLEPLNGDIELECEEPCEEPSASKRSRTIFLITTPKNSYTHELWIHAFSDQEVEVSTSREILREITSHSNLKVFHYGEYEDIDLDLLQTHPGQYFASSYIYRKAIIRKHYLANTIQHYIAKNPISSLVGSFPTTYLLEVDYAEFLDESLDEAYELRQEIETSNKLWILKPSMADKGQGIRMFQTIEQLQAIFEAFEEESDVNNDDLDTEKDGIIVSQLRHFVVQEYERQPLLLQHYNNRKFHLRVYVVSVGNIAVYVSDKVLTLFAETEFTIASMQSDLKYQDLSAHLTNTCLQEGKNPLVQPFWQLDDLSLSQKVRIFDSIKSVSRELFKAATSVDKINFQPLENAMEFYGLDFLVNSDLAVKLLEVNAYPDFKQSGDDLKPLISNLIFATALLISSEFFGFPLQTQNSASLHRVL